MKHLHPARQPLELPLLTHEGSGHIVRVNYRGYYHSRKSVRGVPGSKFARFCAARLRRLRLSLFEKVILANSLVLICEALAGLWVTSHNLEAHHYLIDTSFIVLATLLTLLINVILLRASFRPLFELLRTMRAVSAGKRNARATTNTSDPEIGELAQAFNTMLDRL